MSAKNSKSLSRNRSLDSPVADNASHADNISPAEWGIYRDVDLSDEKAISLEYPYKNLWYNMDDVLVAMRNLRSYKLKISRLPVSLPKIDMRFVRVPVRKIDTSPNDYAEMNFISDMFSESVRNKCYRFDDTRTQQEYWDKNKEEIVSKLDPVTILALNRIVYKNVLGCGSFRTSLVCGFIEMYKSRSVLDISSGWGDRLIACIAKNVRYLGYDPNKNLENSYEEIIKTLGKNDPKYDVIIEPFEKNPVPKNEKFDMVFSSPPFFNLEIYSDADTQSASAQTSLQDWIVKFLRPALDKAWDAVKEGGYMIINMNNVAGDLDIVSPMINYMPIPVHQVFAHSERTTPGALAQPIFVWHKPTQKQRPVRTTVKNRR